MVCTSFVSTPPFLLIAAPLKLSSVLLRYLITLGVNHGPTIDRARHADFSRRQNRSRSVFDSSSCSLLPCQTTPARSYTAPTLHRTELFVCPLLSFSPSLCGCTSTLPLPFICVNIFYSCLEPSSAMLLRRTHDALMHAHTRTHTWIDGCTSN